VSSGPHPWSCDEAQSPSEPRDGPWTIELHRHLVGSIELLPTLIFSRDVPFQHLFFEWQWHLLWWLEWELCCSICHVEQLGDSALLDHNRKGETGSWDGCIDAYGLERLQPHLPFQDDNGLPTHNLWLALAIFVASCSSWVGWIDTSDSYDRCKCALDYPRDSASRLSMHERQRWALGHGWVVLFMMSELSWCISDCVTILH
jgi:hypothetical protein